MVTESCHSLYPSENYGWSCARQFLRLWFSSGLGLDKSSGVDLVVALALVPQSNSFQPFQKSDKLFWILVNLEELKWGGQRWRSIRMSSPASFPNAQLAGTSKEALSVCLIEQKDSAPPHAPRLQVYRCSCSTEGDQGKMG